MNVERGAGLLAGFTDEQYEQNGANIVDVDQIWNSSAILVKVSTNGELKVFFFGEETG